MNKSKLLRAIKKELKSDVKEYDIDNATQLVHWFYMNYVDIDKFNTLHDFDTLKKIDAYTNLNDLFDFNKKIKFLMEERIDLIKFEDFNYLIN